MKIAFKKYLINGMKLTKKNRLQFAQEYNNVFIKYHVCMRKMIVYQRKIKIIWEEKFATEYKA